MQVPQFFQRPAVRQTLLVFYYLGIIAAQLRQKGVGPGGQSPLRAGMQRGPSPLAKRDVTGLPRKQSV